jgi:hypothetical protein
MCVLQLNVHFSYIASFDAENYLRFLMFPRENRHRVLCFALLCHNKYVEYICPHIIYYFTCIPYPNIPK